MDACSANTSVTGTIPPEIGLLTELTNLQLCKLFVFNKCMLISEYNVLKTRKSSTEIFTNIETNKNTSMRSFVVSSCTDGNSFLGTVPDEIFTMELLRTLNLGK